MASVRRRAESVFWYACINLGEGKVKHFSTGLKDEKEALAVAVAAERSVRMMKDKPHQLRAALERLSEDFVPKEDSAPGPWLLAWSAAKKAEVGDRSWELYDSTAREAADWLEEHGIKSFTAFTPAKVLELRAHWLKGAIASTVNSKMKRLRIALKVAVARDKKMQENPAAGLPKLRETDTVRRDFRPAEWNLLFPVLAGEWKAITLLGLNTGGQRLNNLAALRHRQVDVAEKMATFMAPKTNKLVSVPLMQATIDALMDLPSTDDPNAFVFPKIAQMARTTRSNAFRSILASVGLARPLPTKNKRKKPENEKSTGKRQVSELSFHSLRHTATSWLKAAGVTDGVVRGIVGHETVAMSKTYTHHDTETIRAALEKLPVFAAGK